MRQNRRAFCPYIFPRKGRIYDPVLLQEYTVQRKPVFWHILLGEQSVATNLIELSLFWIKVLLIVHSLKHFPSSHLQNSIHDNWKALYAQFPRLFGLTDLHLHPSVRKISIGTIFMSSETVIGSKIWSTSAGTYCRAALCIFLK